ncbi:MAG: hypothetical protein ING59_10460 [Burkholderiales bacterium]|nr:hypothetical protein [Burkholderiales bacterium]
MAGNALPDRRVHLPLHILTLAVVAARPGGIASFVNLMIAERNRALAGG